MKCKFELTAGALIRSSIRRALKSFKEDLLFAYPNSEMIVEEDRAFWDSAFYIRISATDEAYPKVRAFTDWLKQKCEES